MTTTMTTPNIPQGTCCNPEDESSCCNGAGGCNC